MGGGMKRRTLGAVVREIDDATMRLVSIGQWIAEARPKDDARLFDYRSALAEIDQAIWLVKVARRHLLGTHPQSRRRKRREKGQCQHRAADPRRTGR